MMTTKLLVPVSIMMYFLTNQILLADELCDHMTAEEISQFAVAHLDDWKGSILMQSSFSPESTEYSKFVQERPFPVYTITSESIQNYATQGTFESTLTLRGMWYVPVLTTDSLLEIHCQAGSLDITGLMSNSQMAEQINKLSEQVDLALTKNWMVRIEPTYRFFLALESNTETLIYPLADSFNQYITLKPIDSLGGYKASEVLLLIATEFLKTANAVSISPELNIHIPKAFYEEEPVAGGFPPTLWVNMKYLPNSENRLLFEVTEYGPNGNGFTR
ncbi:MAG: hypothetical protein HC877_16380 [Thioploca sp.]|nr:hypothetical protein [Thioploca sp.]